MTVIIAEDVVPGPLQASNKEKMLAKVVNQRKETARVALRRAVVVADVVDRHGVTSVAISAEEEAVGRHDALAARMARWELISDWLLWSFAISIIDRESNTFAESYAFALSQISEMVYLKTYRRSKKW